MIIYVLANIDNHRDNIYEAFEDREDALERARELTAETVETYGDMPYYDYEEFLAGSDRIYSFSGKEHWTITIDIVELK